MDLYNRLYRERILFLGQQIDDEIANQMIGVMLYLDSEDDKKPISMYINCPGGSVTSGFAMFDTMRHVKSEVRSRLTKLGTITRDRAGVREGSRVVGLVGCLWQRCAGARLRGMALASFDRSQRSTWASPRRWAASCWSGAPRVGAWRCHIRE